MDLILKLIIVVANITFTVLNAKCKTKEKSATNLELQYESARRKIFFYLKINK